MYIHTYIFMCACILIKQSFKFRNLERRKEEERRMEGWRREGETETEEIDISNHGTSTSHQPPTWFASDLDSFQQDQICKLQSKCEGIFSFCNFSFLFPYSSHICSFSKQEQPIVNVKCHLHGSEFWLHADLLS